MADKGCQSGLLVSAGPRAGCSTAGGSGWVTMALVETKLVAVTTMVLVSNSSSDKVGVGAIVGKITSSVRVGVIVSKGAATVGVGVAVGRRVRG